MEIIFEYLTFNVENEKIRLTKVGNFLSSTSPLDSHIFTEVNIVGRNRNPFLGLKTTFSSESFLLKYCSHNVNKNKLEIIQKNDLIQVKTIFEKFDYSEAIRVYSEVENISDHQIVLDEASPLSISGFGNKEINYAKNIILTEFAQAHHTECQPLTRSFFDRGLTSSTLQGQNKILVNNIGSWSTKERLPQAIINNKNNKSVFMFQIESNNSWFYEIGDKMGVYYLNFGTANINYCGWAKKLQPHEVYKTIFVTFVTKNTESQVIEEMFKYRKHNFRVIESEKQMPVIFNEYMHLAWDDPNEERVKIMAPIVKELGAEYYVIDCGWHAEEYAPHIYEFVGEWKECKRRFPNGIKAIADYLKSLGLKLGLWIEPEVVGIGCKKMIEYYGKEGLITRYGEPVTAHTRYFLDFRCKKVRDYLNETISRMINEYGASYIKMDYNQDLGIGTDKDSDSFGEGLEQIEEAYLKWVDEIQDKFPDVIFETCSSGGLRMDYRTLSKFPLYSISDQVDYKKNPYLLGNLFAATIPEQAAVWCYPVASEPLGSQINTDKNWLEQNITKEKVAMNMINTFCFRVCLASHLELLSLENKSLVIEGIEYYKSLNNFRKNALPYMPLGFTDFSKDTVAYGLKKEKQIYLAVYNLNGNKNKEIELDSKIKSAKIEYPSCSLSKINYSGKKLQIIFDKEIEAVFVAIDLE